MSRLMLAAVALVGGAGAGWAGPGDLFAEKAVDFGVSPKGTVLVHYFRFTNTTGQALSVGTPRVSCGCVSATVNKNQLAPGESAAVTAYMDTRRIPTANVPKTVLVYVPFLAPTQEEVALKVQTVARDDLLMSPDVLAFGTVKAGAGGTAAVKVSFLGDPGWKVTEAKSTGGYVAAAVREDARGNGLVTYEVTATLDKACPAGVWVADVFLATSNPAVAKLRVPVTVTVTPDTVVPAAK